MATQKQIQANRLNSLKSTGPRSVEGKAVSSQNALKSGIDSQSQVIRGEDPAALESLAADYLRDHQPQSAAERALVDMLIDTEWLLRRLRKAEAQLWECEFAKHEDRHQRWEGGPMPQNQLLGKAYDDSQTTFARLERRREVLQRTWHRVLQDLRDLQASRPVAAPPPDAPHSLEAFPATPATHSFQKPNQRIGFVPADPFPAPPEPAAQPARPPAPFASPTPSDPASPGSPALPHLIESPSLNESFREDLTITH